MHYALPLIWRIRLFWAVPCLLLLAAGAGLYGLIRDVDRFTKATGQAAQAFSAAASLQGAAARLYIARQNATEETRFQTARAELNTAFLFASQTVESPGARRVVNLVELELRSDPGDAASLGRVLELVQSLNELGRERFEEALADRPSAGLLGRLSAVFIFFAALFLAAFAGLDIRRRFETPFKRSLGAVKVQTSPPGEEMELLSEKVEALVERAAQAKKGLEQSREAVVRLEKTAQVGKLAAGVAHSVRNPLTSVKMRLYSLKQELVLNPAQEEDFSVIAEEIRNIEAIVKNFLEYARRPKLRLKRVSPSGIVDAAVDLLKPKLDSLGVRVRIERERILPPAALDPDQVKEAFVNLLVNAAEAMPQGGRIVVFEDEGVMEPLGRVAVLKFADEGPGVPEAERERIFEPFFSTKPEGSGLGLSIVKGIVEDHGGWVHVAESKSGGAQFVLVVPLAAKDAWLRA